MGIRESLAKVVERVDLSEAEAAEAMGEIVAGSATPAQVGAFAVALRMKGETADEMAGLARVMRDAALPVATTGAVLDTAGTGGDAASRALAVRVRERGADMLDAPVSGSVLTLEQGKLSVMVGGDPTTFARG